MGARFMHKYWCAILVHKLRSSLGNSTPSNKKRRAPIFIRMFMGINSHFSSLNLIEICLTRWSSLLKISFHYRHWKSPEMAMWSSIWCSIVRWYNICKNKLVDNSHIHVHYISHAEITVVDLCKIINMNFLIIFLHSCRSYLIASLSRALNWISYQQQERLSTLSYAVIM